MRARLEPGNPPDFERLVAGMVRLRRHGYGAAAAIAVIGAIGSRDPTWACAAALSLAGFAAGFGIARPDLRLVAGLIIDHVVALSLWWMIGPSSVVDLLPIVIFSLTAFILPTRAAIYTIAGGLALVTLRIPFHLAGSDGTFPMYWTDGSVPMGEVVVSTLTLLALAIGAAAVFFSVGNLLDRSRAQMQSSARRYQGLVEASPDGILIHRAGMLKYVNEAAAEMLGYGSPLAAVDMPYLDHIDPSDRPKEIERMHQIAKGEATGFVDLQICRTDGTTQPVEAVAIPTELDGQPAAQVIFRDLATRQALRDVEIMLETAFNSSVTCMAVVDLEGHYVKVNQAQCDLFGYTEQEFLKMGWRDLTEERDLPASEAAVAQLLRDDTDDSSSLTKRYRRSDGSQVDAHTTVTVVRDDAGHPAYLYSHTVDLSDTTRAAEALRESEERYRTLFERIPVALYRSTPDGRVLDANPALVELMGFGERDGLLGLESNDIYVDPGRRDEWKAAISRDGTVLRFEAELRRKDGSTFWSQDSARIVRDEEGNILYYEGAITDITSEKTAEQARRRLTRIIEATPDIVVVIDPSGWVVYANSAARTYFSIADDQETPYMHVSQALGREMMQTLVSEIIPTLKEGEAWTGDLEIYAADGAILPVSAVGLAHYTDSGELARFSAVLRDMSEQVEATRQLQDLVRTKDEFVASVSHELRTPLTAVVGLAQELRDHWRIFEESELEDLIKLIADQGTEVSAIVQDLLVAARADIGSITITPSTIDVGEEIQAALKTIPNDLTERLEMRVDSVAAWADPGRLRQIIRNLVTNAFRYGGANVGVYAHNGGGLAVIEVTDDGDGIPTADRHRVFDPYFRAHDMPSQPASVGLGLTVSRQLAELMGGELTYDYVNGVSRFSVKLPTGPRAEYSAS